MIARLRSWWKNTSKTLDAVIILSLVILLALVVMIILGYIYNWTWAGLHGKTLYDWLQLLIIPAVLAVGGYLFNYTTSRNEQKATQLRAQTEREAAEKSAQTERDIALDNQREVALQEYIDKMSELLLEKQLRVSEPEDEVRTIARVRTLTVLRGLDGVRKGNVLQFLHESGLLYKDKCIIDLQHADLSEANLKGANLKGASLYSIKLSKADLSFAILTDTVLISTNLREVLLYFSDLRNANLKDTTLYITLICILPT
jgi:uncharacterized membrane protein